ncbi:MAG: hypothetical protein AAB261_06810, partial [Chloroflexota bacterium]
MKVRQRGKATRDQTASVSKTDAVLYATKTEGRAGTNRDGSRALRRRATTEPATTAASITFFHPDLL